MRGWSHTAVEARGWRVGRGGQVGKFCRAHMVRSVTAINDDVCFTRESGSQSRGWKKSVFGHGGQIRDQTHTPPMK